MTTDTEPTVLNILRNLDLRYAARAQRRTGYYWLPCCNFDYSWTLLRSDHNAVDPAASCGPGDAGEEAALRVAISRNRALCPAEPVAQEVDG